MKRWWILAALMMVALLAVAPGPGQAQTVTYAAGADPDSLDPANAESNPSEAVNRMIFENLVKFDPKLNLVPGLAEKWEQAKDGMSWTFFLRKGVKFHDGTPFNAEAAKYFFDRMIGPEKPSRAGLYAPLVDSTAVVDEYTVKVNMKAPFAFLLNNIAHSASGIVSPDRPQGHGKRHRPQAGGDRPLQVRGMGARRPRDAGPERQLLGRQAEAGKDHRQNGQGRKRPRDDAAVRRCPVGRAPALGGHSPPGEGRQYPAGCHRDPAGALHRVQLRQEAVQRRAGAPGLQPGHGPGVDREKHLPGPGLAASNIVAPLTTGYFPLPPYPYDPEKSKKLLAEAGYPNGLKAKFISPQGRYPKDFEMSQALQQQWKKAGIDVTLDTMEWAAYLAATRKPADQTDVEVFLLGWAPSSAEARWCLYPLYHSAEWVPKGNNRLFYSNKQFDDYVDKLTKATEKADRDNNLKLAQELLYKELPQIPILVTKETIGYSKKLKGVINSPLELTYFDQNTTLEK